MSCGDPLLLGGSSRPRRGSAASGLLVGLVALVALAAPTQAGSGFVDVSPSHPFHAEISWAAGEGIVQGYEDGTFRSSASVTRQAMAAFLHRLAGSPASTPTVATFADVSLTHPFAEEIEWLASEGIAEGYHDGTFRPGAAVSRQAMAAYLYRFAGAPPPPADLAAVFTDVSHTHPFFVPIAFLYDFGIGEGYDDGTYRPLVAVSRQATAAFLFRLDALLAPASAGAAAGAEAGGLVTPADRVVALGPWMPRG
jgi:hypothetical protein